MKRENLELIASLSGDYRWEAMVKELEHIERDAFESILSPSITKEIVSAAVTAVRQIKAMPERAIAELNKVKR